MKIFKVLFILLFINGIFLVGLALYRMFAK